MCTNLGCWDRSREPFVYRTGGHRGPVLGHLDSSSPQLRELMMSDFWKRQKAGLHLASGLRRATGNALPGAVRLGQYSAAKTPANLARSNATGAILAPGDPPPPPGDDVLDYRGLA